jgi:hypothetical protein
MVFKLDGIQSGKECLCVWRVVSLRVIRSRSRSARSRNLRLGDRTLPSIVLGDWHNLRQLIRIADLDYTE